MPSIDRLRLLGSPDTNKVMMAELSRLSRRKLSRVPPVPRKSARAGLVYPFDPELAVLAVRYQRTATRVFWELYESRTSRLEPLYAELVQMVVDDTRPWGWPDASISVRARNVGEFAAGERQVVGTVKNALIDGAAERGMTLHVDPRRPDLSFDVRMHDDALTVSIDLMGRSLSQRGYRESHGAAPLREHLAAVLCMAIRYDARSEILLDPMCGSGTICIEGALMARATPHTREPWSRVFERSPLFPDTADFSRPLFDDTQPRVFGNDVSPQAYRDARDNAARARVDGTCVWRCGDFRDLSSTDVIEHFSAYEGDPTENGVILCNPPYGHRLQERELLQMYRDLSDWCSRFDGWRAGFLVANDAWPEAFGRRERMRKSLQNGPIGCQLFVYDL